MNQQALSGKALTGTSIDLADVEAAERRIRRIGIGIAPSLPSRLFVTVDAVKNGGLYRSDDAGARWYKLAEDARVTTRESDFAEVKVDPKNPDVVYVASVVAWKSAARLTRRCGAGSDSSSFRET